MRIFRPALFAGVLLALLGCGSYPTVPDLGLAAPDRRADLPWPELRPTRELQARGAVDVSGSEQGLATLEARAAALRVRARSLSRPLIDRSTRARMLRLMRQR